MNTYNPSSYWGTQEIPIKSAVKLRSWEVAEAAHFGHDSLQEEVCEVAPTCRCMGTSGKKDRHHWKSIVMNRKPLNQAGSRKRSDSNSRLGQQWWQQQHVASHQHQCVLERSSGSNDACENPDSFPQGQPARSRKPLPTFHRMGL